jgi:hypothetical protein
MTPSHTDPPPKTLDAVVRPVAFTRADLGAVALLIASLLAMFWKAAFTSAMFFYRDIYNYTFPSARFIHDLCRQGFVPYWNPYLNYGQPVLANPNLLFFYPFTLLIVLLPVDIAYTLHFLVHFALAGIGVYVLARAWGQTCLAAFFAAIVFMFSGPVLSLGDLYNQVACAAWIPWALLATDRAVESGRLRSWTLLVVIFSLQWLAGEPMTMLGTFGLCFAYAFYRRGVWSKLWSKPNLRVVIIFFLVGASMILLCAAQFLPASHLLTQSRRGVQGLRFRESSNWAVNPFSLPEIMVPDFFGSGIGAPTGWLWLMSDSNLPYFLSIFIGFVPLFFALAGWALGGDRRSNFAAGASGIFLLLSFGHFTPVFALAYLLFPPLAVVRYPVKLLIIVTFLIAMLAGWGFDGLRAADSPWKTHGHRLLNPLKVFLASIVAILAVAWLLPAMIMSPTGRVLSTLGESPFNVQQMPDFLVTILRYQLPGLAGFCLGGIVLAYGMEQRRSWARPGLYAFALLAIGQLIAVNSGANPTVPKTFFTYRPPVLNEFKGVPGSYRVASFWPIVQTPGAGNLQTYINFDKVPEAVSFGPVAEGALQTRLQLAAGSMLNQVEGNINLDLERSLPPYLYDVEIFQDRQAMDPLHVDCLLGRTNVKYIIRPTPVNTSVDHLLGDVANGSSMPSKLYEDLCFAPRTFVAGNSLFSTNSADTLNHLASPDFDATGTVILATAAGSAPAVSGSAPAGHVEIVHRDPNSVTLRAQLARPAYVVLLDRYDPDWRATLDGHSAPTIRADQIFRAVYAGAGAHEIRFDYRQSGFHVGIVISCLTLMAMAVVYFKR